MPRSDVGVRAARPRRARGAERRRPPRRDGSPSRYIARIDTHSGREIPGPIDPEELLVHAHRDQHPLEVGAQFLASRVIQLTGNERAVRRGLKGVNSLALSAAETVGSLLGSRAVERRAKKLIGAVERDHVFRFRDPTRVPEDEVHARIERLQQQARAALKARGRKPRLHILLTGATGFLGKEVLVQAAGDPRVEKVYAVLRPETVRDRETGEVVKLVRPVERGRRLLERLHIAGARARKFEFLEGDIEKTSLGIAPAALGRLQTTLTHVIHCAASVSFDDPYEASFRANVLGSVNALEFSLGVQKAPGSAFVQHVAIETSYIHGRKKASIAQEDALVFPRHFYNNFYELTKAMASIETDRFLVERGLRVSQLLPSIVVGDSRTGNNRGDTKVVNAPINAFGRAKQAVDATGWRPLPRLRARLISLAASGFPGDPSAELNLVPVERVVAGILAALTIPEAIGNRIHLATDNRIRSEEMVRITREELGARVRLVDPTVYRNLTLPFVKGTLTRLKEPKLAGALEKLGSIFGGYSEWGQPVHSVGNDVRILGLPIRRPDTRHAFRMLCRHNRFVQDYGRVRDPEEIARRERVWGRALSRIERRTGHEAGAIPAEEFRSLLREEIDLDGFRLRAPSEAEPRRRA